ncbi:MAG: hypothetical protein V4463_14845 [Pseudomonadota bacterium]
MSTASCSDNFFLARQSILGRDRHLVAFELLFRTAGASTAGVTDLEILETVRATPSILARVGERKALGFKFVLDDVIADSGDVRKLIALVDVIKVDLQDVGRRDARS